VKVRSLYLALVMLVVLWGLLDIETNPPVGQVFDKDLEVRVDTLPTLSHGRACHFTRHRIR